MKQVFWIIVALLLLSIGVNVWQWRHQPEPSVVVERDTVWKDTTIIKPVPTETKETGETIYVKVPVVSDTHGDSPHCDTAASHVWTVPSVSPSVSQIALPVEQKRYDDSLYTAWVSGYRPNLDSIDLRLPTITETVTKTIVKPSPRLSVGIQAGAGVGVFSRQPDIYLGVGAQWRFWPK